MKQELLLTAPDGAIPNLHTKAYKFLSMLSCGEPIAKKTFLIELGESMRSPLQDIEGDCYLWWNIHRVSIDGEPYYLLDSRHLSGNWELDAQARSERKLKLRGVSYQLAIDESARLPVAREKLNLALKENAQQEPSV